MRIVRSLSSLPGLPAVTATLALIVAVLAFFALPDLGKAEGTTRGKEIFEKRCGGCHSLDRDKEGPRLRGVYGRGPARWRRSSIRMR
jgi:cytochrome c2